MAGEILKSVNLFTKWNLNHTDLFLKFDSLTDWFVCGFLQLTVKVKIEISIFLGLHKMIV